MDVQEWTACDCPKCRKCCEYRPCWPTYDEALRLIAAGLGNQLMVDYWVGDCYNEGDIHLLCPAIVGYESKRAPYAPFGTCTFFSENGCALHDAGLKPIEGRLALPCQDVDVGTLHRDVAETWNNPEAQALTESHGSGQDETSGIELPPPSSADLVALVDAWFTRSLLP